MKPTSFVFLELFTYATSRASEQIFIFLLLLLLFTLAFWLYLTILCFLQESKFLKFLGFMWNPLSWVMEAAAIMAIALANGGVSALSFQTSLLWGAFYFFRESRKGKKK